MSTGKTKDADYEFAYARDVAAPMNAMRFSINTPCRKTGTCADCKSPDTICCQFLATRYSMRYGCIHAVLVNGSLGSKGSSHTARKNVGTAIGVGVIATESFR